MRAIFAWVNTTLSIIPALDYYCIMDFEITNINIIFEYGVVTVLE